MSYPDAETKYSEAGKRGMFWISRHQELEAGGHIASTVREQRLHANVQLFFSIYTVQGMAPPTVDVSPHVN